MKPHACHFVGGPGLAPDNRRLCAKHSDQRLTAGTNTTQASNTQNPPAPAGRNVRELQAITRTEAPSPFALPEIPPPGGDRHMEV